MADETVFARARSLEVKLEIRHKRAFAREFAVEADWIQSIILVGQIQNPNGEFCTAARKTVPGKQIELPEIIVRQRGCIGPIVLRPPQRIGFCKETARMIVNHEEIQLV